MRLSSKLDEEKKIHSSSDLLLKITALESLYKQTCKGMLVVSCLLTVQVNVLLKNISNTKLFLLLKITFEERELTITLLKVIWLRF